MNWVNLVQLSQYSLFVGEKLSAILTCQRMALRSDNLYIAAPPTPAEGEYVGILLTRFLQENWTSRPLTVEYPAGRANRGFESSGLTLTRTLLWMHAEI